MKKYLLSIYQPDGPPPPRDALQKIMHDVDAVRKDMQAAGVWVFSGGLFPPSTATVLKSRNDDVLVTDGPYLEGKEHIGGFTIIAVPDLDAALHWGRKLARALPLPIEVRPFQDGHSS